MNLEQKVAKDLITAMKAKDEAGKRGIRAIKQAILMSKTDGSGTTLNEADEIKMLQKLVKQRKDSIAIYEQQGREDLAVIEREEVSVIEKYLPQQMEEAELEIYLRQLLKTMDVTSMKDMGKVMGRASKELAGRADGKTISGMVKQLLNS
ncbi:MAG: GatB/YqeY domain-containing protein [Bacteroidota bacterium]